MGGLDKVQMPSVNNPGTYSSVCIDLEDAVSVDEKQASRANVVRAFRELDFGRKLKAFRINALDTPFAYRDLVEVVEEAGDRLDVVAGGR